MTPAPAAACPAVERDELPATSTADLVLIDDDPLVRSLWKAQAIRRGQTLRAYARFDAFCSDAASIPKCTPIYIDSQLRGDVPGEERVAEVHGLGFQFIYLTTGRTDKSFANLPHLAGIIGKNGPF